MASRSFPLFTPPLFPSPAASAELPLPYPAEEHGAVRGFIFGLLIEGSLALLVLLFLTLR